MTIDIRPYDLEIKDIKTRTGETMEVVQLKPSIAFDPGFIAQAKAEGVGKYIDRTE